MLILCETEKKKQELSKKNYANPDKNNKFVPLFKKNISVKSNL